MKTLITILSVLVLLGPMVFAADTGPLKPVAVPKPASSANVQAHPDETRTVSTPPFVSVPVSTPPFVKIAKNATELKEIVREKESQLNRELEKVEAREQNIYRNQNKVAVAVHTFLAMENIVGGIGKNVSAIAREFNNSIKNTTALEAKIVERSAIVKFFIGRDQKAVGELEKTLNDTAVKIDRLGQLGQKCDCDNETKAVLREQITNMETEQARLMSLVSTEKKNTGILGWLFK